jgi:putative transposase
LGLARSTRYYRPAGESAANLALMRAIDEQYLRTPFYGSRKFAELLGVNRKRVQRLMRVMGIEAIYPKRRTTWPAAGQQIYPYLLRNVAITRRDQVWSSDITYVPLRQGFLYLVAVLDWYSRYVLAWRLSNTLTGSFCVEALDEALSQATPEIFNTDQGSQFTATAFTSRLQNAGVAISTTRKRVPRPWPGDRQRVHRAAVAFGEVRGRVLERLRQWLGSGSVARGVLPLLQSPADSPVARLPYAGGRLSGARLKPWATLRRRSN